MTTRATRVLPRSRRPGSRWSRGAGDAPNVPAASSPTPTPICASRTESIPHRPIEPLPASSPASTRRSTSGFEFGEEPVGRTRSGNGDGGASVSASTSRARDAVVTRAPAARTTTSYASRNSAQFACSLTERAAVGASSRAIDPRRTRQFGPRRLANRRSAAATRRTLASFASAREVNPSFAARVRRPTCGSSSSSSQGYREREGGWPPGPPRPGEVSRLPSRRRAAEARLVQRLLASARRSAIRAAIREAENAPAASYRTRVHDGGVVRRVLKANPPSWQ